MYFNVLLNWFRSNIFNQMSKTASLSIIQMVWSSCYIMLECGHYVLWNCIFPSPTKTGHDCFSHAIKYYQVNCSQNKPDFLCLCCENTSKCTGYRSIKLMVFFHPRIWDLEPNYSFQTHLYSHSTYHNIKYINRIWFISNIFAHTFIDRSI